ncbi:MULTISPECIES: hypothetical protein [Nocardia]|uniref:hypothetical protein n=2 Tax=Nocardiaceae TaxID=85025 RepID=UPI002456F8B9|nr:hypothetical protein [Nocardia abscessus]
MSQPSRIDTGELRAMVSTLERLIAEAARTVGELKATIASAEALVSGDHHGEQPAPARAEAVIAQAPAAESPAESDRTAMPTPWSRRPPATPWSRRVVRPCPTVPSTPVRVSAPRAAGVPIAELPAPAWQTAAPRRSEFEFTRGRTGAVGDSGSVRRTDSADGAPAPQVGVTADSVPIRRTEYADHPAPVQRADADVVDSAPIRRTGGAPIPQIDNLHEPRSAGRTSITPGPAFTRQPGTTPSHAADHPTKADTAPRHEPVPLIADGFPPIKRTAAVPVAESATPHQRPPGRRTEHIQGTTAQRADPPQHLVSRRKDSSSAVPQADSGQPDTADAFPSVAEIDTAHGAEPVPPIDTADEPVAIERTDTTSRLAPTIAEGPPARADNEHRPELISPIDLANCLASASVHRTPPRSTESATRRRPVPTQQFEATDDTAADGRTDDPTTIQQTDPRSTESATPWGPAPIPQPDATHDSVPARQFEATDDIAAGGRTDDRTTIQRTDPASNNESGAPNHPAIQRTASSAEPASGRQAPTTATPRHNRTHHSPPEQRPAPAPSERMNISHRPPPQTDTSDISEVSRIAQEMSERHGLKCVGFDGADVDVQAVREIASAIDDLLAKYPIPLRGVELTDDPESRPRPQPTTIAEGSAEVWIFLDKAAPQSPGGAAPQQTRRIFRKRGPVERPVYSTVVREFARALDVAGGFRARQEALRTLINESLLRGGSGAGLLDPGRALVEGFTEVVLRGDRAGASAKELHAALVKMARAESTDLPESTDPPQPTDLPESSDLSA